MLVSSLSNVKFEGEKRKGSSFAKRLAPNLADPRCTEALTVNGPMTFLLPSRLSLALSEGLTLETSAWKLFTSTNLHYQLVKLHITKLSCYIPRKLPPLWTCVLFKQRNPFLDPSFGLRNLKACFVKVILILRCSSLSLAFQNLKAFLLQGISLLIRFRLKKHKFSAFVYTSKS